MSQPPSTTESERGETDAIAFLHRISAITRQPSVDGSVNHDSLVFLARFAGGEISNYGHAMGAVRCSRTTPEQLTKMLVLLEATTKEMTSADVFPRLVEEKLGIRSAKLQQFPPPKREPTGEEHHRAEEFFRDQRAQHQILQERAAADERLDWAIAELLGVQVKKLEEAWGWAREDTGVAFSPVSDPAIAFYLIERFRLDIRFAMNDIVVLFFSSEDYDDLHQIYASNHGGSLTRAVAAAVCRKASLKSRQR